MTKTNALTFIGKSHFDVNVIGDNEILYGVGDEITPDIILKLYFKDILIQAPQKAVVEAPPPMPHSQNIKVSGSIEVKNINDFNDNILKPRQKPESLIFDQEEAQMFSEFCYNFAKVMNYGQNALEEIKISAYYHKVGRIDFVDKDENEPDFIEKMANASAKILEIMGMSFPVIEGARNFHKKYLSNIPLDESTIIPYSHVIAIASCYKGYMKKHNDKTKCLEILRKNGVRYLNVFVLHRFINYMRNLDE